MLPSCRPLALAAALASALLSTAPVAHGATLNIAANGTLIGASGVNVLGTLYDVTFADGVLKDGVTAFTTPDSALAASNALLDQVFLGDYDTLAKETNGCSQVSTTVPRGITRPSCTVLTPYHHGATSDVFSVFSGYAENWTGQTYPQYPPGTITVDRAFLSQIEAGGGFVTELGHGISQNPYTTTATYLYQTLASWSAHVPAAVEVPPVPEPQTGALMLAGLGVVGGAAARRRRAACEEAAAA